MHRNLLHQDVLTRGTHTLPARADTPQTRWPPAPAFTRLLACLVAGAFLHLTLWQVSEPPTLFSDLYKAYFPAAEVLWDVGLQAHFPFTEVGAGGFVNVPLLAWLFVPLVPLGEHALRGIAAPCAVFTLPDA